MSMLSHQKQEYSKVYPQWAINALNAVYKHPEGSPKRWRKSAAIWLNLNPVDPVDGLTAKQQYIETRKQAAEKRATLSNKFGALEVGREKVDFREQLLIPEGMFTFIKMFDRMAFDKENPMAKKNLEKLSKEFPELSIAEKF